MPFAVVFLFPDGHTFLDLVDDEATGVESGFPVSGRYRDPDRQITQGQRPNAVYAYDRQNRKMLTGLCQNPVSFLLGQRRKCFVIKTFYGSPVIVTPDPPLKGDQGASLVVGQPTSGLSGLDWFIDKENIPLNLLRPGE